MINCRITREKSIRVKADGTAHDLAVETAAIIKQVYTSIREQDEAAAEQYRVVLLSIVAMPDSPVWEPEWVEDKA